MALDRGELAARAVAARAALLSLCDALSALVPVAPASGAPATEPRRTVGGDGEPVAWAVRSGTGEYDTFRWTAAEAHEEVARLNSDEYGHDVQKVVKRRPFTVAPLYTRPAATGDTGEGEKARADFLAWVNAGYLVRDAVTDVEWDDEGLPLYYTRNDGERHYLDGEWHAWLAAKGVNCG